MTVLCPSGHLSSTTDYCDQCGKPIVIGPPAPQPTEILPAVEDADTDTSPAPSREPCPKCGTPRSAQDRFCEKCGHNFLAPPATAPAWEAVATTDRDRFERFAFDGGTRPAEPAERSFVLTADRLRIGRSGGAGASPPEIDLAGGLEDPAVSRVHAVLERRPDGSYTLRDLGSTNGTTVNGTPVGTETGVALASGDCIRIGAWTAITVRNG